MNTEIYFGLPIRFFPTITLAQYQQFFDELFKSDVIYSVYSEEFLNTGAYVMIEYEKKWDDAIMQYVVAHKDICEIDGETLADMEPEDDEDDNEDTD